MHASPNVSLVHLDVIVFAAALYVVHCDVSLPQECSIAMAAMKTALLLAAARADLR